jgi:WD repeat-containing protein 22
VNTTLVHPHMLHVVTSGVERDILLHSPTPSSPCCRHLSLTDTAVRQLPDEGSLDAFQTVGIWDRTQAHVLNLFDRILRDEGGVDVFTARQWGTNPDLSESDSDVDV